MIPQETLKIVSLMALNTYLPWIPANQAELYFPVAIRPVAPIVQWGTSKPLTPPTLYFVQGCEFEFRSGFFSPKTHEWKAISRAYDPDSKNSTEGKGSSILLASKMKTSKQKKCGTIHPPVTPADAQILNRKLLTGSQSGRWDDNTHLSTQKVPTIRALLLLSCVQHPTLPETFRICPVHAVTAAIVPSEHSRSRAQQFVAAGVTACIPTLGNVFKRSSFGVFFS